MEPANYDPRIYRLVATNEGVNLSNLWHLQHTMSINDLYDSIEALEVASSWAVAHRKNEKEKRAK